MEHDILKALFVGAIFGFVSGLFLGAITVIMYGWKYLQADPDGPGGWRSRMQAMTTEHDSRVHSITSNKE